METYFATFDNVSTKVFGPKLNEEESKRSIRSPNQVISNDNGEEFNFGLMKRKDNIHKSSKFEENLKTKAINLKTDPSSLSSILLECKNVKNSLTKIRTPKEQKQYVKLS